MRFQDLSLTDLRDLSESMATVAAATTAGIFTALDEEKATPEKLARRLELDPRAVGILLPLLEELGLVEGREGGYRPTPRAQRELIDSGAPEYAAGGLPLWLSNLEAWTRLPEALKTGEPIGDQETEDDSRTQRERISRFMAGMAAAPEERIRKLVGGVLARRPEARTLLDLGGGPGHISRAFVEQGLKATLVDRPEVVEFVREEYGLDAITGLRTVGADFLEDPLPTGPFDILLLSNILHMLPPEGARVLLEKAGEVAAPGAVVAVADFVRGLSPRATRFAMTMLLRTEGGNTYTLEDHRAWFRDAGFLDLQVEHLDPERQLLTAVARTA